MIKPASLVAVLVAVFSSAPLAADAGDSAVADPSTAAASAEASASAKRQIEVLLNSYQERLKNKSIGGILDLYSAAPVFIPEYAPPAVGREAVRKAYEWVFATLNLDGHFIVHEAEIIGDTAWVRTNSTGKFAVIASGVEGDVANSELFVLKRENGAWKIHRYIFTASAPPAK
jgi:ketosteroid isomerase-like protein